MKLIAILLIAIFGVSILFAVTNPSADDFKLWYEVNYESDLRKSLNAEVQNKLQSSNDALQILIDGAYEIFAKDTVDSTIARYLDSIWNDIDVNRHLFYTEYFIHMPDGYTYNVVGFLNTFKQLN